MNTNGRQIHYTASNMLGGRHDLPARIMSVVPGIAAFHSSALNGMMVDPWYVFLLKKESLLRDAVFTTFLKVHTNTLAHNLCNL